MKPWSKDMWHPARNIRGALFSAPVGAKRPTMPRSGRSVPPLLPPHQLPPLPVNQRMSWTHMSWTHSGAPRSGRV